MYMSYRLDFWTQEDNDEYEESSVTGIGLGMELKEFLFPNRNYFGLFYGYGFDMFFYEI